MSSTQLSNDTATEPAGAVAVPMRLEVVVVPVADVDRAKSFYQGLGWRLDADVSAGEDYHLVQMTPPGSKASIIFGKGVTSDPPGSIGSMLLAVDDIEAAREELAGRGAPVSGLFHFEDGKQADGPDAERSDYNTFFSFDDPDGNAWLVQEVGHRG